MAFTLPKLPYDYDALGPHMSADTLKFHHDKHHKAYVDKLNKAIEGTPYTQLSLGEIIQKSWRKDWEVFNNAGQHWNHSFFWQSLTQDGGGMSNNPAINVFNLGKPSYSKVAFSLGQEVRAMTIRMRYM